MTPIVRSLVALLGVFTWLMLHTQFRLYMGQSTLVCLVIAQIGLLVRMKWEDYHWSQPNFYDEKRLPAGWGDVLLFCLGGIVLGGLSTLGI